MESLVKKLKLKRFIATLLLVCTVMSTFFTSISSVNNITVSANSNDLRSLYMQLMSGRDFTQLDEISSLTADDLRVVALFLSNFYVPWTTQLDENEEAATSNKNTMISALQSLGFNKDVAEQLVDVTFKCSLESAQKIYTESGDYGFEYNDAGPLVTDDTLENDTYTSYVGVEEDGKTPLTIFEWWCGSVASNVPAPECEGTTYYVKTESGWNKVWDWNTQTRDLYVSFLMKDGTSNLETQQIQRGYFGNAFSQLQLVNGNIDGSDITDDERGKSAIFTQNMYVDWVGNIIADLGLYRVVVIPAACNPYVFSSISNDTSDNSDKSPFFNLISLRGLRLLNFRGEKTSSNEYKLKKASSDDANCARTYLVWALGYMDTCYDKCWDSDRAWFHQRSGYAGEWATWLTGLDVEVEEGNNSDAFRAENDEGTVCAKFGHFFSETTLSKSNALGQLIYYDNAGLSKYKSIDTESVFEVADFFGDDVDAVGKFFSSSNTGYSSMNTGEDFVQKMLTFNGADKQVLSSIYLTYAFAYNNTGKTEFNVATDYVDMQFNDIFPQAGSDNITWDTSNAVDDQIKSFIYYLLHPAEGARYVATLFKTKIGGIFVSWHEDIVGAGNSNVTTGSTRYLGMTGYATSPSLNDVEWVARGLNFYNNIIVYIIILMSIILLCYLMTGALSLQRALLGFIMFSVCAFVPPVAITATVDAINMVCDRIYGTKFEFWALCQNQTYLSSLESLTDAGSSSNTFDYYTALIAMNETKGSATEAAGNFGGAKLKWMSPKKFNELSAMHNELETALTTGYANYGSTISLITSMVSNATSSETYVDTANATYLYRDFLDIYRYSSSSQALYTAYSFGGTLNSSYSSIYHGLPTDTNSASTNRWGNTSHSDMLVPNTNIPFNALYMTNARKYLSSATAGVSDTIQPALYDTSSLHAIARGFLVNTINLDTSNSLDENNIDNASFKVEDYNYYSSQTTALSLFTGFTDECVKVDSHLKNFEEYASGAKVLEITADNMKKEPDDTDSIYFGLSHSDFNFALTDYLEYADKTLPAGGGSEYETWKKKLYDNLNPFYYSLYTESPYYFFNYNIRDQLYTTQGYILNTNMPTSSTGNLYKMLLNDSQSYFFNLTTNSGNGYGELRDFMNMHDLFYYIVPMLENGNLLVDEFDQLFGMYVNDDCSLQITSAGKIKYSGTEYSSLSDMEDVFNDMTEEQRYKFWHDYNVWTLFNCYTTWLDTMQDCDYAKPETITVMGDKFKVSDPLNPLTYFKTDAVGNLVEGRYMVFSRSEMAYYGLTEADLTTVESKIITIQDNVYKQALGIMNYYTMADETLINALAMLEIFEFNKEFSQSKLIGESFELYPQTYELKTFTYDAYLRLILSQASGESLMTSDSSSIYERILKNTSLFFGIFLIINDAVATYVIPYFKLAIIILIFFTSLLLIIASAVKLEFNILTVVWKSIGAPLLSYAGICIGMAWIVSLFMSNGAVGVTTTSSTISVGDPTAAIIIMLVINVIVCVLLFKILKKCFHDFKTYFKAVFDNLASTVGGAFKTVAGAVVAGKAVGAVKRGFGSAATTASQRGRDNSPTSGKRGIGGSFASGAAAGAGFGLGKEYMSEKTKEALEANKQREDAKRGMNKYDAKAYDKATAKSDALADKRARLDNKLSAEDLSEGKRKRLEKARNKMDARVSRANNNADNISKYGRFGAMRKQIGTAASTAKQTASKGLGTAKATAKSGMSRAQSLANTASANAKKAGRFVKEGGVGRVVGAGAGHIANGASATANFVRQSPQNIKKGARAVGTKVSDGAKQAASYTAQTVREAPVAVKKAGMSALNAEREAGRTVARATVNTGRRVATETANIARANASEGKRSYNTTRK